MPAISFLGAIGKAVLKHGINALAGGVPLGDALLGVASDVMAEWSKQKKEAERRAELEAVAKAAAEEVRKKVTEIVRELAGRESEEVRNNLTDYLNQVPEMIRERFRRPDDPTGATAPPDLPLSKPSDLLPLIPNLIRRATEELDQQRAEQIRMLKNRLRDGLLRKGYVEAYGTVLELFSLVPHDPEVVEAKRFLERDTTVKSWMRRRVRVALGFSLLGGALLGGGSGFLLHLIAFEMGELGWLGRLIATVLFGILGGVNTIFCVWGVVNGLRLSVVKKSALGHLATVATKALSDDGPPENADNSFMLNLVVGVLGACLFGYLAWTAPLTGFLVVGTVSGIAAAPNFLGYLGGLVWWGRWSGSREKSRGINPNYGKAFLNKDYSPASPSQPTSDPHENHEQQKRTNDEQQTNDDPTDFWWT